LGFEETDIDPFVIYDLLLSNSGGLICSHCGKKITADDLLEEKIVMGNIDGYLSHVDCLLSYIIKAEPTISSGLASGLFSESQVRHDLLSKPFESVILDMSRACSLKRLTPSTRQCSKFIASESNIIESRIKFNLEVILSFLDENYSDPMDSDVN